MTEDEANQSVHVELWTDIARRERYQHYAKERYEFYKSAREMAYKANIDYGKWLLASGVAIHGGAIYAINSLKDPTRPQLLASLLSAAKWNCAGIVFIMLAGLFTWLNFQYAASLYHKWANPLMVYRTDQFPDDNAERWNWVGATRYFAIMFGTLSLWSLIASAVGVFSALQAK